MRAWVISKQMTGAKLITQERERQIEKELWDDEHDDDHTCMTLATAGAAYALDAAAKYTGEHKSWKKIFKECAERVWPFDTEWFKPTPNDPVRQLVKAGALIAAEIDRFQREDKEDK